MSKKGMFLAVLLFAGAFVVSGCSNNATDEEMNQLHKLQSQATDLQKQINDKQAQKSDLQKQIADRDDKLKQCQADQDEAKKALGK